MDKAIKKAIVKCTISPENEERLRARTIDAVQK